MMTGSRSPLLVLTLLLIGIPCHAETKQYTIPRSPSLLRILTEVAANEKFIESKRGEWEASKRECSIGSEVRIPCVREEEGAIFFVSKFPVADPRREYPRGMESFDGWLQLTDEILDADESIRQWEAAANNGDYLECRESDCLSVVSTRNPQGLALCSTSVAGTVSGAPEHCRQVYVVSADARWIRVVIGALLPAPPVGAGGRKDLEFKLVDVEESVVPTLRKEIKLSFSQKPLRLSFNSSESTSVTGVVDGLASEVLRGWREQMTVRVDIYKKDSNVKVVVSSTVYLNRQNTESSEDWHQPTILQTAQYVEAMKNSTYLGINASCLGSLEDTSRGWKCVGKWKKSPDTMR